MLQLEKNDLLLMEHFLVRNFFLFGPWNMKIVILSCGIDTITEEFTVVDGIFIIFGNY